MVGEFLVACSITRRGQAPLVAHFALPEWPGGSRVDAAIRAAMQILLDHCVRDVMMAGRSTAEARTFLVPNTSRGAAAASCNSCARSTSDGHTSGETRHPYVVALEVPGLVSPVCGEAAAVVDSTDYQVWSQAATRTQLLHGRSGSHALVERPLRPTDAPRGIPAVSAAVEFDQRPACAAGWPRPTINRNRARRWSRTRRRATAANDT